VQYPDMPPEPRQQPEARSAGLPVPGPRAAGVPLVLPLLGALLGLVLARWGGQQGLVTVIA
jgi:hypothetical protein